MNRHAVRLGAAAAAYVLLALLFGVYFFDPAVPPSPVVVGVWVALGLGAGLVAASWWALLLALPAGVAVYQHVVLEVAFFAALIAGLATVILLSVGAALGKASRGARWVGIGLLTVCLLTVPFGLFRHMSPYDATPSAAVLLDLDLGSAGDVHIDEDIVDVRKRLGAPDWEEPEVLTWDGLVVWHDGGVVAAVEVEDERFQTVDGVGVGDSLAHARRRWPGLVCDRDGFREVYCAGLAGPRLVLLEGNPIRSLTVSGNVCWPDLQGLWPPDADSCAEGTRVLKPLLPARS